MDFTYGAFSLGHLQVLDPREVIFVTDVGRVIVEFLQGRPVQELIRTGAYLAAEPYPGSFRVIRKAVQTFGCVGIVSRCNPVVQEMVENWLEHWNFYEETGFDRNNQHFTTTCEAKAQKVYDEFGNDTTYFLDDGMQVLLPMEGIVRHRILFGPQKAIPVLPSGVSWMDNWDETALFMGLA